MATTLIGAGSDNSYSHSIRTTQSGINVESFSVSVEPEFREDLLDTTGHIQGQAIGSPQTTLTISGEVIRSSDGASFIGAFLSSNVDLVTDSTGDLTLEASLAPNGGPETEFVLQSSEITQTRGSYESGTLTFIARANLTVA